MHPRDPDRIRFPGGLARVEEGFGGVRRNGLPDLLQEFAPEDGVLWIDDSGGPAAEGGRCRIEVAGADGDAEESAIVRVRCGEAEHAVGFARQHLAVGQPLESPFAWRDDLDRKFRGAARWGRRGPEWGTEHGPGMGLDRDGLRGAIRLPVGPKHGDRGCNSPLAVAGWVAVNWSPSAACSHSSNG